MTSRLARADSGAVPPSSSRGRRWLAIVGYLGLSLIGLAVAALVLLLVAPPLGPVRDRLIQQVEARTGRTLTVAGPMSVSLFPRVVVTLGGVAMPPPEGMAGAPTLTVPSINAEVGLWSLLSRRPKLERITLNQPIVELAVDAQGRRSWDADPKPRQPAPPPAAAAKASDPAVSAAPPASQPSARPRRPRPLAVRVVGGTVHYRNERSGTAYELSALDLDVMANAADAALAASGAFAWEGTPFRFSATATPEPDAAVVIRLDGAPIEATYEGSLAVHDGVSAEGMLSVARLAYKDLKLGPAKLALSVADGTAKVTLQDAEVYGGRGQGSLTFDTAGLAPSLSVSLKLTDVSLLPLLRDAAGAAWIDGRGAVTLALAGQGASERQVVESLQGQVQLTVAEGAVTGFDVDKTMRALQRGRLDRLVPRRDDRTPFSALNATFDVAGGVAKTSDLKLVSTHVQLSGEGQIELAARHIDATLQTKIDGGAPADDAVVSIGTLELPISIKGPLDRPEFTIKGQEGLSDAINRIGKNLKSREVKDAIEGLLSGDRSKRVKPGELLDKLLKKE